jgi:hypothetical protein
MKRLSRYVEALRLGAVIDGKAPAGGSLAGTTVITPMFEPLQLTGLGASTASFTAYVNDNISGTFVVSAVAVVFGTASSSGTLQVEVATGTQAVASGTNQLTGTVSLAGTANTTVNGTVIASPTTITAGSRVNVIIAGTMTSLANCAVVITLQRTA